MKNSVGYRSLSDYLILFMKAKFIIFQSLLQQKRVNNTAKKNRTKTNWIKVKLLNLKMYEKFNEEKNKSKLVEKGSSLKGKELKCIIESRSFSQLLRTIICST